MQADQPTTNFGTATGLRVDASPATSAYLRFDVTGLTAPPFKATLRVFTRTSGTTGLDLYTLADTSWHETAITYASAPPIGRTSEPQNTQAAVKYPAVTASSP